MRKFLLSLLSSSLVGCTGMPESVEPVKGFDESRYLGKWYEIARLDHSFEQGLQIDGVSRSMGSVWIETK